MTKINVEPQGLKLFGKVSQSRVLQEEREEKSSCMSLWITNRGEKKVRGHPDLNRGPLDLQSNALPLSYTPTLDHDWEYFSQDHVGTVMDILTPTII